MSPSRLWTAGGALLALAACGPDVDREAAAQHLRDHRAAFDGLRVDLAETVPDSLGVEIELGEPGTFDFKVWLPPDGSRTNPRSVTAWGAADGDPEVARGLDLLGWSPADLRRLRDRIAVLGVSAHGSGLTALYRRGDGGRYYYSVSGSAREPEPTLGFNGCASYQVDARAALFFDGGKMGPVCMPGGSQEAAY